MPSELSGMFEQKMELLAKFLEKALAGALSQYGELRQAGQKGELKHIYISFLISGVLCKLPWLRIDLCDERGQNDSAECACEWDVSTVSDRLYRDADELAKKRERIKDYELDRLWLDLASRYMRVFEQSLPRIIGQCPVSHELNCQWSFGQYLGETVIVRERLDDEIF